jgi:hypothetical protein
MLRKTERRTEEPSRRAARDARRRWQKPEPAIVYRPTHGAKTTELHQVERAKTEKGPDTEPERRRTNTPRMTETEARPKLGADPCTGERRNQRGNQLVNSWSSRKPKTWNSKCDRTMHATRAPIEKHEGGIRRAGRRQRLHSVGFKEKLKSD